MIKKPLEGRTPTGLSAVKAMENLEKVTKVSHLRLNEFRVEGDLFIPRPWRMRGYVLCPNITNQGLLYRGDAIDLDEHGNVSPKYSMASLKEENMADKLYRRMRWEDLGLTLLRTHPIYRLLARGIEIPTQKNEYFRVSSSVLLHSYGMPSPYISLTADKEIALFYAVTDYDEKLKRFLPTKKKYGILSCYRLKEPLSQTTRVFPIGLQVFDRPGLNKEFSCKLRPHEDFFELPEVTGLVFYQDERLSEQMLDKYEGGDLLCPKDDILSKKMEQSEGYLLEMTFQRFLRRFPQFKNDLECVRDKYRVTDEIRDLFRFCREELIDHDESFEVWWNKFCKKIYFEADRNLDREYFEHLPYDTYYSRYFDTWML